MHLDHVVGTGEQRFRTLAVTQCVILSGEIHLSQLGTLIVMVMDTELFSGAKLPMF